MTAPPSPDAPWLQIVRLLRWDKPAGRLILMVPALWAVVLAAQGSPPLDLLIVVILGSLATSAAGCVVNDLWDRDIDPQVARTRHRPLAARALSVQVGVAVLILALGCAWVLARYLNPLSFWLCVLAVPVILLYPLAKRVFPLPQLVLALAWGFAILISWAAVAGKLEPVTWLLWGATVAWTLGFDTVYALADRPDDTRLGIHSSARFFGDFTPGAVGLCYLVTAVLLAIVAIVYPLGPGFWPLWLMACGLWAWQVGRLVRVSEQANQGFYGRLFSQNVTAGTLVLVGFWLGSR